MLEPVARSFRICGQMSEVYANILEGLTTGLYNDVKYAVREYLQNAYDAIIQSRSENLPLVDDMYCVNVEVSRNNAVVTIADNGVGMDLPLLREYTSIGGGTKNSPEYAGHKGIGKLSGLRFFEDFRVVSKVYGSTVAHELHWRCGEMMRILSAQRERMKKIPYKEFISQFFDIREIDGEDEDRHYTQVQLIGVTDEFGHQLSEERIGDFIRQNCPVPFCADRFAHSHRISEWLGKDLACIDTLINEKIVYRHYADEHLLAVPQLTDVRYDDQIRAKVWFSWINNTAETIADERIRGIRFRCKGLCVGDSNLFANNCMPPGRDQLANWFTGEVIVTDENIVPTTARDKFNEGRDTERFFDELKTKVGKALSVIADTRSEISAAQSECTAIENMKNEGNAVPAYLLKRLLDRIGRLERLQTRDRYSFDFGVVHRMRGIMEDEEAGEGGNGGSQEDTVDYLVKQGTDAIIGRMLELKEQEVNLFSRKAKENRRHQIEELRKHVTDHAVPPVDSASVPHLAVVLAAIAKYLTQKGYPYDEAELRVFLSSELYGK